MRVFVVVSHGFSSLFMLSGLGTGNNQAHEVVVSSGWASI